MTTEIVPVNGNITKNLLASSSPKKYVTTLSTLLIDLTESSATSTLELSSVVSEKNAVRTTENPLRSKLAQLLSEDQLGIKCK